MPLSLINYPFSSVTGVDLDTFILINVAQVTFGGYCGPAVKPSH